MLICLSKELLVTPPDTRTTPCQLSATACLATLQRGYISRPFAVWGLAIHDQYEICYWLYI